MVQRSFMPRFVRALEEVIPRVIDRLISAIDTGQPVDMVAQIATRFAPVIMAHLIGLPSHRRDEMARLSATLMQGVDPGVDFATRRASVYVGRAKRDIIRELIAARRASPRDGLVDTLVAAVHGELSEAELIALLHNPLSGR